MIYINSYQYRNEFRDLILRWMYGVLHPVDAQLVHRLVHFNNVYVDRYLAAFSRQIFTALHGEDLSSRRVHLKRELKDVIVADPPHENPRIAELIRNYKEHPERYYGETPFHGTLFFKATPTGPRYVGSNRIKRVRRLAEKCARRIVDQIFVAIKRHADELANERARTRGILREQLFTSPEEMRAEFEKSENDLIQDLRKQQPIRLADRLEINDVAGLKVILEDDEYGRILELLEKSPGCEIYEEEPHAGAYNARNLVIRHRPDRDKLLEQGLGDGTLHLMRMRGLAPDQANREFAEFVRHGDEVVYIEIIASNYEEMLESEIGRCMHEDRIIDQRLKQEYQGNLAKNVEYLMLYLFNSAVAPLKEVKELPILLWYRYLPDYVDDLTRGMFNVPPLRVVE